MSDLKTYYVEYEAKVKYRVEIEAANEDEARRKWKQQDFDFSDFGYPKEVECYPDELVYIGLA